MSENQNPSEDWDEQDPNGMVAGSAGAKLDAGKNRLGLVLGAFASALWAIGEVGTFGANKYSDNGWQEVPNAKARYSDAMMRHWHKIQMGESYDPESGMLHAAHMGWNALAFLYFTIKEQNDEPQKQEAYKAKEQTYSEDSSVWKTIPDTRLSEPSIRPGKAGRPGCKSESRESK